MEVSIQNNSTTDTLLVTGICKSENDATDLFGINREKTVTERFALRPDETELFIVNHDTVFMLEEL